MLDENDVNVIIGSAVANAGPLKTALAAKLDIDDAFTRDDTIDVVNDLINGAAGDGDDTLRAVLDAINERLESLEAVTGETCGRHCRAGEYVKTPCTGADSPTVCDTCPAQTYSLGGLPNACTDCSTCVWVGMGQVAVSMMLLAVSMMLLAVVLVCAPTGDVLRWRHSHVPRRPYAQMLGWRIRERRLYIVDRHDMHRVQDLRRQPMGQRALRRDK